MGTVKTESLDPQDEEGIEWIRWVPKEHVFSFLKKSYKNIIDIVQKSGLVDRKE